MRLLRLPLLLLTAVLGLFGIFFGLIVLLLYLASLRSFGVPFLSPFAPVRRHEMTDTLVPVSYTHLDVYKRQVLDDIEQAGTDQAEGGDDEADLDGPPESKTFQFYQITYRPGDADNPVSYTHLDVYKRQLPQPGRWQYPRMRYPSL